jgi:hypothetical protein
MKNPQNLKGKGFDKHPEHINKNGRPRKLPDLDSLLIDVLGERIHDSEALQEILVALRKKAMAGDVRAAEVLLDRAFGKIKQQTELSGSIVAGPITGIQIILDDCKTQITTETGADS